MTGFRFPNGHKVHLTSFSRYEHWQLMMRSDESSMASCGMGHWPIGAEKFLNQLFARCSSFLAGRQTR
jgi:hypothetical protein